MRRKALVVLLSVMALIAVTVGSVSAAGWYTCTISETGSNNNFYYITVSDNAIPPGFPANTMFFIDPTQPIGGKEMYAAALTAFANSTNVKVYLFGAPPSQFDLCGGVMVSK